ncbi:MAG: DUF2007 domain-containing protein [Oscillospiraceae bacterium]|nr:DUF2007 domain-containing protein [Oscillospiraceae bacterium]
MRAWGRHEYGKLYDSWPKDGQGQPEEPVLLTTCSPLDLEAQMVQSMLEAYGIPSLRHLPGDGAFGELIVGMSGSGIDIYVPKSALAQAQELMKGEPDDDGIQA